MRDEKIAYGRRMRIGRPFRRGHRPRPLPGPHHSFIFLSILSEPKKKQLKSVAAASVPLGCRPKQLVRTNSDPAAGKSAATCRPQTRVGNF